MSGDTLRWRDFPIGNDGRVNILQRISLWRIGDFVKLDVVLGKVNRLFQVLLGEFVTVVPTYLRLLHIPQQLVERR